MTKLVWDQTGEKRYETGVDRGVLYLSDGSGVPWNGLISVDDVVEEANITPYYLDGVRFFNERTIGDYAGVIKAYTYPDEFLEFDGYGEITIGLYATHQPVTSTFGLSYRTLIGNDVSGIDYAYKIHLLYNLTAIPSTQSFSSTSNSADVLDFSWDITGLPVEVPEFRPTVHFILDSRKILPAIMATIEAMLYGSGSADPLLPDISEVMDLIFNVIDNGDGTWTAKGSGEIIQFIDPETFSITWPGAVYIDEDTYTLSNTVDGE